MGCRKEVQTVGAEAPRPFFNIPVCILILNHDSGNDALTLFFLKPAMIRGGVITDMELYTTGSRPAGLIPAVTYVKNLGIIISVISEKLV